MQLQINKVRVTDTRSEFNNKVVTLTIDDGIISGIKEVSKNAGKAAPVITEDGKVLWQGISNEELMVSPGWVDVFADYREPGYEHKETLESGMNAAAAGGFTHVLLVPNTQPAVSSKSIIQYILQKGVGHAVSIFPMGTATQYAEGKDLAEMLDMRANGAIAFTDGWKPLQNANLLLKALEYVKAFDGIVIQMPVDASLASGGLMNEGIVSTGLGMAGIPALAETFMVYRDIELLKYTTSRLHITGISTAVSVDVIRTAKAEGLDVTCSVTPYHLALTDEVLKSYDSVFKVSPPLRGEADRQALIAGLADGTIDCIASHHRPHEWDAKEKEFEYAADGMNIQETAFNVLWETLKEQIGVEQLIGALGAQPRKIFGLDPAMITKGNKAALSFFTTDGTSTLAKENKRSAGINNPFLNTPLAGKVVGVYNNGQIKLNN